MKFMERMRLRARTRAVEGWIEARRYCTVQHDFDIADGPGASVRGDLNDSLEALVTWNSGAADPVTTFPRMRAIQTTAGVVKRRNGANSAWIVESTDDETLVVSRSSNTMLDVSDKGKAVLATGTWSQTFDAAATLTDGWFLDYRNDGVGVITLDPNASETINGAATLALAAGESCRIVCNGTALKTVGITATPVGASVQFVTTASSAYASGTTQLPNDDTIPQNTEGDEYITQAITPTNASNLLVIDVTLFAASTASGQFTAALFQDSTANALAAISNDVVAGSFRTMCLQHVMAAGTTSARTIKVRAGLNGPGTTSINGRAGARVFGGVASSRITITEIKQ